MITSWFEKEDEYLVPEPREMAQQLSVPAAFAKDPSSLSST